MKLHVMIFWLYNCKQDQHGCQKASQLLALHQISNVPILEINNSRPASFAANILHGKIFCLLVIKPKNQHIHYQTVPVKILQIRKHVLIIKEFHENTSCDISTWRARFLCLTSVTSRFSALRHCYNRQPSYVTGIIINSINSLTGKIILHV